MRATIRQALRFGWIATLALAVPVPLLDIVQLFDTSDIVVVAAPQRFSVLGKETLNVYGRSVSAKAMSVELAVLRTLKGSVVTSSLPVRYYDPDEPIGYARVIPEATAIFFVKVENGARYFTSRYYPFVVASAECSESRTAGNVNAIVAELGCVLTETAGTEDRRRSSVYALDHLETDSATKALQLALTNPSATARVGAIAALLRRGDLSALLVAEPLFLDTGGASEDTRHNLAYALASGVRASESIPVLQRILHSPDVILRRAAAEALRHTASPKAIDDLVEAINDSDREVRYFGVIGLAEITGQDNWAPSVDYFALHEAAFLQHWREWAKAQQ